MPFSSQTFRPVSRPHLRGFTLIEIMVVIVLVGIIASLAMISLGGTRTNPAEETAKRITTVIKNLRQEALFRQNDYGLAFHDTGYRILKWNGTEWLLPDSESLTMAPEYRFGQETGLELNMLVEGRPWNASDTNAGSGATEVPGLIVLSTGEATDFELEVLHPASGHRWRIIGDILGQLTLKDESPNRLP